MSYSTKGSHQLMMKSNTTLHIQPQALANIRNFLMPL